MQWVCKTDSIGSLYWETLSHLHQTRLVDPRSILADQSRRTGWDVKHRCLHLCPITFSLQTCIYIRPALGNYPQSGNQLRCHILWFFLILTLSYSCCMTHHLCPSPT